MNSTVSRWGEHGDRPESEPANDDIFAEFAASASIEVACPCETAWDLITDIRRIGEFSPECIGAEWLDGARGPSVGARFEGTNRVADETAGFEYIWIRPCTVTVVEPPNRFSYTVGDRYDGTAATSWDIEIETTLTGCRISQNFEHLAQGLSGVRLEADSSPDRAAEIVKARTESLTDGITQTLQAMKRVLEPTE
jgi:uncharacterized protein YndB with AHSA1/START domain